MARRSTSYSWGGGGGFYQVAAEEIFPLFEAITADQLKLRLNVKFKNGTAPALLAEFSSIPERRRVKRLLDLAQIGLL